MGWSGSGQSRQNWAARAMSGLPPLATELRTSRDVSNVPNSEVAILFDHLVSLGKQGLWHGETERLCSVQIDDQFELGRQLHRQVGRRCPAQDPVNIGCGASKEVFGIRRIGYERAALRNAGNNGDTKLQRLLVGE